MRRLDALHKGVTCCCNLISDTRNIIPFTAICQSKLMLSRIGACNMYLRKSHHTPCLFCLGLCWGPLGYCADVIKSNSPCFVAAQSAYAVFRNHPCAVSALFACGVSTCRPCAIASDCACAVPTHCAHAVQARCAGTIYT